MLIINYHKFSPKKVQSLQRQKSLSIALTCFCIGTMQHRLSDELRNLAHAIYKDFFSEEKNENIIGKMLIFFLYFSSKHCGYTLEPPRRGGSNEYPQCMVLIKI